jgi:hypothetical protein
MNMDERIKRLDGISAVQILRNVARKWIEQKGLEAFVVIDNIRRSFGVSYDNPPSWLLDPPETASSELVALSKLALSEILEGEQSEPRNWVEDELENQESARAHVLDPVTLTIVGATLIGLILASRVKKIGNTEFYEGVPKETVEIVEHATSILVPKVKDT